MATIKYFGEAAGKELASKLKGYVDGKLESLLDTEFIKVVSELPDEGESNYMYLTPAENTEEQNQYAEYVWADGQWEKLGEVQLNTDLTGLKEAVEKAQETADTAVTNAATAQTAAESAATAASEAQSTADTAVANAATAQTTAESAATAASGAQSTADEAKELAEQANTALDGKQDTLTAGDGISIDDNNTVSCTTVYTEVTADDVDAWDVWDE